MNLLLKHSSARSRRGSLVVGVLFAFAVVIGGELYRTNSVAGLAEGPQAAVANIALALAAGLAAAIAAYLLFAAQGALERKYTRSIPAAFAAWRATAIIAAALFLCWLPCLLAYWPGVLTYDIGTQTDYVISGSWTTQQPPLHTLAWAFFLQLEGACGLHAITWYAFAQMAFLAFAFSCTLAFLAHRGVHPAIWTLAAAFFALNPVVALFSITPAKDVPLAGFLILALIGVARLITDPKEFFCEKPRCAGLAGCLIVCCLLRPNMLAAVAVFAIVAIVVLDEARKAVAALLCASLAVALLVEGPIYSAAGVAPGSSAVASVPFQQVANIASRHASELNDSELAAIERIIPIEEAVDRYNPRFADRVVRLFKGRDVGAAGMRDELADFTLVWLDLCARYPGDALDAFLTLNVPYWYPFASTPDPYSERAYIETDPWKTSTYYTVDSASKLLWLREAYEGVADYSALDNPACGLVFSPSSALWFIVLAFFLLYCSGSRRRALLVVLPALFWLSFLIGPVSNMRYIFPLFCLYPLLAASALQPKLILPIEKKATTKALE